MDSKAPVSSISLFKETTIDLEPAPGSVIEVQVPSTSTFSVRSRQQRRVLRTSPTYTDEGSFNKYCLASSGSIYFAKSKSYPRSFLWRVVQDQTVLVLRSVDLSKSDRETREATFTIQFCFSGPIKRGGVALADTEDANVLNVFVLTKGNELYTFTLPKDFFCNAAASEEDIRRWCKISRPATFSISTPHRLVAGSTTQLVVSLSDGRLLQLMRKKEDDGSKWHESVYGDGQWASSLRGLVRWQGSNTVRYDGATLEQNTPAALAVSPDGKHVFAVCMNHTLRIWNPSKPTNVFSKDLLWQPREPHEVPKLMLDPGNANVLQIFQTDKAVEGDLYYAVTFSPHNFGQFKFWGIRDPDYGEKGVRDMYPEYSLKPPDPDPSPESKAIWKVADFRINSGRYGQALEMWILMRSNKSYKLYNLKFDTEDLATRWQDQWSTTARETMNQHLQPQASNLDPEDVTEKWLDYILCPGKFTEPVLESALSIYSSERGIVPSKTNASLEARMCSAIGSQVNVGIGNADLENYRTATHHEWTVLWQDIRDLDKSRWEVLSLAHDDHTGIPWIVFTDGCSAIRTSSRIETIAQNSSEVLARSGDFLDTPSVEMETGAEPRLPDELAIVIEASATFRQSFSNRLQQTCQRTLTAELWLEAAYSVPLRIQAFYDQCNFSEEIGSAQFDDLVAALEPLGGFDNLETDTFLSILDSFSHDLPPASSGFLYTEYGLKTLVNGAREMIDLRERTLSNLLALVVFVDLEIDREEIPMENFDGSRIYTALLNLLKQYQIMQWLAKNVRIEVAANRQDSQQSMMTNGKPSSDRHEKISTILESIFARDLKPQSTSTQSQSEALTYSTQDLLKWVVGGNDPNHPVEFEDVPVSIQCDLLKHNNSELASDFLRFQPSTAWATYVKGRLCLMKGEVSEAAIYFKKAAFKLSRPRVFDYQGASNLLLSPIEAAHFGEGIPTYYAHILNLFASASHHTQVGHFAHLALQIVPSQPSTDQATSLLTSLFNASLHTTDFTTAYSALTRHPNPESLLPIFTQTLLSTPNALPQLLRLPFPPNLRDFLDTLLAHHKNPQILAAWRLHHNDFRGAAAALLPPLQQAQAKAKRGANDGLEEGYLAVINLLACAGDENEWVLTDGVDTRGEKEMMGIKTKRKVVTIGDVRDLYQKELDRRSVIEGGRFGFGFGNGNGNVGGGGDEMDVL